MQIANVWTCREYSRCRLPRRKGKKFDCLYLFILANMRILSANGHFTDQAGAKFQTSVWMSAIAGIGEIVVPRLRNTALAVGNAILWASKIVSAPLQGR